MLELVLQAVAVCLPVRMRQVSTPAVLRPHLALPHYALLLLLLPAAAVVLVCGVQDEKFLITKRCFERQYAQLYFSRLMLLQPLMMQQVQQAWPNTRGGQALCCMMLVGGQPMMRLRQGNCSSAAEPCSPLVAPHPQMPASSSSCAGGSWFSSCLPSSLTLMPCMINARLPQ
jgi:hypothetical protein